jgi:HEAT repeat protein
MEAAVIPLLEDFSDDVRIGAARALSRLGAGEAGRDALVQLLLRDADNARVRGEVLQALCDLGADVKGHRPSVEPLLVEPFFLDREARVKRRG